MEVDAFCRELLARLGVEVPDPVNPYAGLYDELGLDSIQAFEALVITEVLADCMAPPADMPSLFTLMDAYDYYGKCRAETVALFEE
jgi:hypothetical protein